MYIIIYISNIHLPVTSNIHRTLVVVIAKHTPTFTDLLARNIRIYLNYVCMHV